MTRQQRRGLSSMEGQQVSVALGDGTRIDDCNLISSHHRANTLWLFTSGQDRFVAIDDVVDVWETDTSWARAA
jgi:hypothetical protein